jgi:tRNA (guanosine-2'-O-)-methyltransferase
MSENKPDKALGPTDIKRLNRQWRKRTTGRIALLLHALTSPYNTGSIIRSAAVFGVEKIYICGSTPAPGEASVGKMAMGCEKHLEVVSLDESGAGAIDYLRNDGWSPVGLELTQEATPLHEGRHRHSSASADVCLVVGNEAHGLPPSVLASCDGSVYLPQPGKVASLNVAVATAVAVHELRRQEWEQDTGDSQVP